MPLSVAVTVRVTLPVYQPFSPVGCAGLSVAETTGGVLSATPGPTKVKASTSTPPVEVTYSLPLPVGAFGSAVVTVCQPAPAGTVTLANGSAVGEFHRSESVPAPEAWVFTEVMPVKSTGS